MPVRSFLWPSPLRQGLTKVAKVPLSLNDFVSHELNLVEIPATIQSLLLCSWLYDRPFENISPITNEAIVSLTKCQLIVPYSPQIDTKVFCAVKGGFCLFLFFIHQAL